MVNPTQSYIILRKPKFYASTNDSRKLLEQTEKPKASILKREKAPGKGSVHSSLAREKPKMSASKDVRKEPKRTRTPVAKPKFQVSNHKRYSLPRNAKKDIKYAGEQKVSNKSEMEKSSSKGQLKEAAGKPKTSPSGKTVGKKRKFILRPQFKHGIDLQNKSYLKGYVPPSLLTFGFVGIGELVYHIIPHLLSVGANVIIWNRTASKCCDLVRLGAIFADSPGAVAEESDIVFCSVRGRAPIVETLEFASENGADEYSISCGYVRIADFQEEEET